jgi:hypothetical protein
MENRNVSTGAWVKETVSSTEHPNGESQRVEADNDPSGYEDSDETPPDTEEDCGCEDAVEE